MHGIFTLNMLVLGHLILRLCGLLISLILYVEAKIREPFHFPVFFVLDIKDMESKSISGVTSTCYVQLAQKVSCMCFGIFMCGGHCRYLLGQGCGNNMPDSSDLVPFLSGQVENFNLLVLGQVQNVYFVF